MKKYCILSSNANYIGTISKYKNKVFLRMLHSSPNNKFLDLSKLKTFANDKIKCKLQTEILLGKGRKHCGKRSYQHFLLLPQCFQRLLCMVSLKVRIVLTLSLLMMPQKAFVDSVDDDQTAQNAQSDL